MITSFANGTAVFSPGTPANQTVDGPEFVELSLCVSQWQYEALAWAAARQDLTASQLLKHIVNDFCSGWKPH